MKNVRHSNETEFSQSGIQASYSELLNNPIINAILESVSGYAILLDENSKAIAVNSHLKSDLNIKNNNVITGLRPGDILCCRNSLNSPHGCSTSQKCQFCGILATINEAFSSNTISEKECSLALMQSDNFLYSEYKVRTTPLEINNSQFVVVIFQDISSEKRRVVLERTFFHDIRNILVGLTGWSEILIKETKSESAQRIHSLTMRMVEDIESHRILLSAEQGNLEVRYEPVSIHQVFASIDHIFGNYELTDGVKLLIRQYEGHLLLKTDESLLTRVIVNMVKNALEASSEGKTVTVYFEDGKQGPSFMVHNENTIPEEIALRIFNRSFSTKARSGRGIGTYSMKLFGEQYLKGIVSFTSDEENGTTFRITLPVETKV
jgi:signal transduction histidine kinase